MRISGSDPAYRADAQAQISAALAAARNGGALPLDGQLTTALATVSKPSEQLFSTFEDYARDFYKTANDISSLSDLTGVQLSKEEATQAILKSQLVALDDGFKRQINALDDILRNAQSQLDAAKGIDTSILSVVAAVKAVEEAIRSLNLQTKQAFSGYATQQSSSVAAALASGAVGSAGVYNSGAATPVGQREQDIASLYSSTLGRSADVSGLSYWANSSLSVSQIAANISSSAEAAARSISVSVQNSMSELVNQQIGSVGGTIRAYAVGTDYVSHDQIAKIHEGERILPAADNRALMSRLQNPQANNDALVAEIRALRTEVASLKASNETTAKATSKFAKQFETASEGGRAILTEVYA
jgi:hypothetical protein